MSDDVWRFGTVQDNTAKLILDVQLAQKILDTRELENRNGGTTGNV